MFMSFPKDVLPVGIIGSCLLLAPLVFYGLGRKRPAFAIYARKPIFLIGAAAMVLFFVGCSSAPTSTQPPIPAGGTPTGSFTIVITSTAGSVQSTTNLTLLVQ
jgi:hypothetical protein